MKPTIFAGVANGMAIAREEIFGPMLAIIRYEKLEKAIRIANDIEYGLADYVQAADLEQARRVALRLRAGQCPSQRWHGSHGPVRQQQEKR